MRARPSRRALLGLAAGAGLAVLAKKAHATPLGLVEVEAGEASELEGPLRVEFSSRNPADIATLLRPAYARSECTGSRVTLLVRDYRPVLRDAPARYLSSTFLVDFDEPAVESVARALERSVGRRPSPEHVRRFVHGWVKKKSLARGFDLASRVAQSREGDCTEHAVLLAALLRKVGVPARVVLGLALFDGAGRIAAGRHAWTEVWGDGRWHELDGSCLERLRRLPMGVVSDESASFASSLVGLIGRLPGRVAVTSV